MRVDVYKFFFLIEWNAEEPMCRFPIAVYAIKYDILA